MTYPLSPSDHYRLHMSRARYMTYKESGLVRLCELLCDEGSWNRDSAFDKFEPRVRMIPGLAGLARKSIRNYFTEVTSFFSLYTLSGDVATVGDNAERLVGDQDLVDFFLHHQTRFQFPGGHVKPQVALEHAELGIRFKPGRFMTEVLVAGSEILGGGRSFGMSPAEATWYITNDLRVLTGKRAPQEVADAILKGRIDGLELGPPVDLGAYRLSDSIGTSPGDFVRYARDCLTMLEYAQVVTTASTGYRYLRHNALDEITTLISDDSFFEGYSSLVGTVPDVDTEEAVREAWLRYANSRADASIGAAAAQSVEDRGPLPVIAEAPTEQTVLDSALDAAHIDTRAIGEIGESIAIRHEKNRLIAASRDDLAKKVKKIPDQLGTGYDILSFEDDGMKRYIEVKTTRSLNRLGVNSFRMTPNEWDTAEDMREHYRVYRVDLAANDGISMVELRDPVGRYKRNEIRMTPRNGADIRFTDEIVENVEVLL